MWNMSNFQRKLPQPISRIYLSKSLDNDHKFLDNIYIHIVSSCFCKYEIFACPPQRIKTHTPKRGMLGMIWNGYISRTLKNMVYLFTAMTLESKLISTDWTCLDPNYMFAQSAGRGSVEYTDCTSAEGYPPQGCPGYDTK